MNIKERAAKTYKEAELREKERDSKHFEDFIDVATRKIITAAGCLRETVVFEDSLLTKSHYETLFVEFLKDEGFTDMVVTKGIKIYSKTFLGKTYRLGTTIEVTIVP